MVISSIINFSKVFFVFIVISVSLFGFVCTGAMKHMSMHTNDNIMKIGSIGEQMKCCDGNILSRAKYLTGTVSVMPQELRNKLLSFMSVIVILFAIYHLKFEISIKNYPISYRFYIKNNPDFSLFDHLRIAFARGIINPKTF